MIIIHLEASNLFWLIISSASSELLSLRDYFFLEGREMPAKNTSIQKIPQQKNLASQSSLGFGADSENADRWTLRLNLPIRSLAKSQISNNNKHLEDLNKLEFRPTTEVAPFESRWIFIIHQLRSWEDEKIFEASSRSSRAIVPKWWKAVSLGWWCNFVALFRRKPINFSFSSEFWHQNTLHSLWIGARMTQSNKQ